VIFLFSNFCFIYHIDNRIWTTNLEEEFYHPFLLTRLKHLRRELRNETEAKQFRDLRDFRTKRYAYQNWEVFKRKRIFLRHILVGYELRNTVMIYGVFINHFKKVAMEFTNAVTIQRVIRGFLARRRRTFIQRVQKKVVQIQSRTRQFMKKKKVDIQKNRLYWAACTIQRLYRGKRIRKKISTMIEAHFDTQQRILKKRKATWEFSRQVKASMAIQMCLRKFLRRRRMMEKMRQKQLQRDLEDEIKEAFENARIEEETYKQELSKWYLARKKEYEEQVMNEKQTAKDKKRILMRRMKQATVERELKQKQKEEKLAKLEEERVEKWIAEWEQKILDTGVKKRQQCKSCLLIPETPEEILLKKDILRRVKVQIKEVLRKADKQKIPMELPEAYEIATQEIIEEEVLKAMEDAKLAMKNEARRLEEERIEREKAALLSEQQNKQKRMFWAILSLQKCARQFLARRALRQQAYKRYERLFSIEHHEYFYQDKVSKRVFWEKPISLGSYDVPMEDYWIIIPGKTSDGVFSKSLSYFYHPATRDQTWIRPSGTVLCDLCEFEFGKINYSEFQNYTDHQNTAHSVHYCLPCFHKKANELIIQYHRKPKDIQFQEFNGGKTDALYMDFTLLPVIDYYTYTLDVNPAMKLSEEEELFLKYQEEAISTKSQGGIPRMCEICFQKKTEFQCYDCNLFYCTNCNHREHKNIRKKDHKRVPVTLPNDGEDADDEEGHEQQRSTKYRKPVLQKTSSLLTDYNSHYDSDNEEEEDRRLREESDYFDQSEATGDERKKKKKKKKKKGTMKEDGKTTKKKKSAGTETEPSDSEANNDAEGDNKEKKKKRKKKIPPVADTQTTDDESRAVQSDQTPLKRKKKKKKVAPDSDIDSSPERTETEPKKKKKNKKSKEKSKENNDESEVDSSPERLKFPPIAGARPKTTNDLEGIFNQKLQLNGETRNDDNELSESMSSPERYSKSAGAALPGQKKEKKPKKKKEKDVNQQGKEEEGENTKKKKRQKDKNESNRDSDMSATENESENPQKEKKKKKDKKPSKVDGGESTGDELSSPNKKPKTDKAKDGEKRKKKTRPPEEKSVVSESEASNAMTPKKEKLKKKPKKTESDGLNESRITDMSSLSGNETDIDGGNKKKKKKKKSADKKTTTAVSGGEEEDSGTEKQKQKEKKIKKKKQKESDFKLPPIV
jgi:hypothetical protein